MTSSVQPRHILLRIVVTALWLVSSNVTGQISPDALRGVMPSSSDDDEGNQLKFPGTPLDIVLEDYSDRTGRTLLRDPKLPKPTITLESQGRLTDDEYLQAVETVLTMHGIGLIPVGDKFLKVIPIASARKEGLDIREDTKQTLLSGTSGELVSQMIGLKHISVSEATTAIQPLHRDYGPGSMHPFERTNSILVTDTADNIARMLQILRYIDRPAEAREEPNIIQIRYAKASEIKAKLEEFIQASQEEQQQKSTTPRPKSSGRPGVERPSVPGVIRARPTTPSVDEPAALEQLIEQAERGIIRGKVHIVADERTNQLIIITRPENMKFFEKVITVLDIETSPDVTVAVIRLEFAEAGEVAGMLNELIGAASKANDQTVGAKTGDETGRGGVTLREIDQRPQADSTSGGKSKVGELSTENIKILSDERTNSLIIMASKSDLETMREIIEDMDMMLSQVLIEAVIIDVSLGDSLETGVDWLQRSLIAYNKDSTGRRTPVSAFAGSGRTGFTSPTDASSLTSASDLTQNGLGYYLTFFDLNLDVVLRAAAKDSRSRVVSTPVILTTDNTTATLQSTEKVYVFEGTTFYDNSNNSSVRYSKADIGLELTVTPRINENRVVMMEIKQRISEPGDVTSTDTDQLAGQRISIDRTLEASIAVRSGQTIVLGGQVRDQNDRSRTKIPLLGDIPLLGRLFRYDSRSKGRAETIVFITPFVLDSPEEVNWETRRRRNALDIEGMWTQRSSGSTLAEPDKKESRRLKNSRRPPLTWSTSNGKRARSATGDGVDIGKPSRSMPPSEDVEPRPATDDDVDPDTFLRSQEDRWNDALDALTDDDE